MIYNNDASEEDEYIEQPDPNQLVNGLDLNQQKPYQQYDTETLEHLKNLSESEVADKIIAVIEDSPLFLSMKQALIAVVQTNLTKSTILANVTNREYAIINLDIALNEADISATSHDMRQPELLQIKDMISTAYDMLLTRARGEHRERMLQNSSRIEVLAGRAGSENTQEKTRTRRGLRR